jgi:hypothetical protein
MMMSVPRACGMTEGGPDADGVVVHRLPHGGPGVMRRCTRKSQSATPSCPNSNSPVCTLQIQIFQKRTSNSPKRKIVEE